MEIKFDAIFGDEVKWVTLHQPSGGGDAYHINIDGYHYGVIVFQNGLWRVTGTRAEKEFTMDDIDALIERVVELEGKNPEQFRT